MINLKRYFYSSQIDRFMLLNSFFDPKSRFQALSLDLQSQQGNRKLQNYMRSSLSVQQQVKLAGLLANLLIKSSNFYELIQDFLQDKKESNDWVISRIILPFRKILIKCSSTSECFQGIKKRKYERESTIKNLTYSIKLTQQIVSIGKELPKLGRYYINRQNDQVFQFFAQTYMVFLDYLYTSLRYNLETYLWNLSKQQDFTDFSQKTMILKWVLLEVIPSFNQNISQINAIKYFKFREKGFVTKLFSIYEQSQAVERWFNIHILYQSLQQIKIQQREAPEDHYMSILEYEQAVFIQQKNSTKNFSQLSTYSSNQSKITERQNSQEPKRSQ